VAGAGRILLNPEVNQAIELSWGLCIASNNEVEALATFKVVMALTKYGIQEAMIVGDSSIIIRSLRNENFPKIQD
jgi:ribonuclease HI